MTRSSYINRIQCRSSKCYHIPICKNALCKITGLQNKCISGQFTHVQSQAPTPKQHYSTNDLSKVTLQSVWIISDVTGCNSVGSCRRDGRWAQGRHLSSAPLSVWVIIKPFHNLKSLSVLNITSTTMHKTYSTGSTAKIQRFCQTFCQFFHVSNDHIHPKKMTHEDAFTL